MVDLPSFDLNVRTLDLGTTKFSADGEIAGNAGASIETAVSTPIATVTVRLGLDRLLYSTSPMDRLLHSPDPLARFRAGSLPSDPSPQMTRGMTTRAGDVHAEIATRHDIGGMRPLEAAVRVDRTGVDPQLTARAAAGADRRGVTAVRDAAETAALPQRVDGAAGATAGQRGLRAGAAIGIAPGAATGPVAGAALAVSFHGLVNILGRTGAPIGSPHDAPPGAVLLYARADGSTVVELRTATGFAGAHGGSTTPLTGDATGRAGDGITLIGVFVAGRGAAMPATPNLSPPIGPPMIDEPRAPSTPTTIIDQGATRAPGLGAAPATLVAGTVSTVAAAVEPPTMNPVRGDAAAIPVQHDATAANAVPPPDGSTIPAGNPAAPGDTAPGFGDATPNADASDRPFIHAIWYDILALRFEAAGVTLLERSAALRDVVWATAMEHGPFAAADGSDVLSCVAAHLDLPHAGDGAIVAAIYAERSRIDDGGGLAHYPQVLPFDQHRVCDRLFEEAELAARRIVTG